MTVVATFLSQKCVVHATDSFLTVPGAKGSRRIVESQATKIVSVRPLRGALAYWGFAGIGGWTTLDWLRKQAQVASTAGSAERFAHDLALALETELTRLRVNRSPAGGIGIHFVVYERIVQYWVPELFLISNLADPVSGSSRPEGVGASRETYGTIRRTDERNGHGRTACRLAVLDYLRRGGWLQYNNGDPILFNPPASALWTMLEVLKARRDLTRLDVEVVRAFTRLPVEVVANVHKNFVREGRRIVGGRIHDLAITQGGEFTSKSGETV